LHIHLFSLFFIQELTEWEVSYSHGRLLRRRCVKGTFFGTFFHARAERKYEKERRRTAVVPFADVNGVLQPYATATDYRYLCSFFPSGKKEPKKVLPSCAAATISRGKMDFPLCYPLKCGVAVRDVCASLKIPRSRRGRRAVHQIYGSKSVAVAE